MRITPAEAKALQLRRPTPTNTISARSFAIFVPGRLENTQNGPQNWKRQAGYRRAWRKRVQEVVAFRLVLGGWTAPRDAPKRVTFRVHVPCGFHTVEAIAAACKPCLDGLVDVGVLRDDRAPWLAEVVYEQGVDPILRGVLIRVEAVDINPETGGKR